MAQPAFGWQTSVTSGQAAPAPAVGFGGFGGFDDDEPSAMGAAAASSGGGGGGGFSFLDTRTPKDEIDVNARSTVEKQAIVVDLLKKQKGHAALDATEIRAASGVDIEVRTWCERGANVVRTWCEHARCACPPPPLPHERVLEGLSPIASQHPESSTAMINGARANDVDKGGTRLIARQRGLPSEPSTPGGTRLVSAAPPRARTPPSAARRTMRSARR